MSEQPTSQAPSSQAQSNPKPTSQRIDRFLKLMNDMGASDLHLSVGRPPIFRLLGRMEPLHHHFISNAEFAELIEPITPPHLWKSYQAEGDCDFAYEVENIARFRVNLLRHERGLGAVFRLIPQQIMTFEQLALPNVVRRFAEFSGGLVLVTGPTGSGKSTTLAAIIHEMNRDRPIHIVTLEDPIEFAHNNLLATLSQREIGVHSKSFASALRAAVREDPDCILVGEMRDLETIEMALSASETGTLVFATLHTNSASKAVDRIITSFPNEQQDAARSVLAIVLKGVLAQQLVQRKRGGRVAALELMFGSPALATIIREGRNHQIPNYITQNSGRGMLGMDSSLRALVEADEISGSAALGKALDKDQMREWLEERGASFDEPY